MCIYENRGYYACLAMGSERLLAKIDAVKSNFLTVLVGHDASHWGECSIKKKAGTKDG